jgi:predicted nucleic-acid-binding Zn-ribbon protein
MSHYVISDNQQNIIIITEKEIDIAIARGSKILEQGSENECNEFYDTFCDECGYTGPIWEKLELNNFDL